MDDHRRLASSIFWESRKRNAARGVENPPSARYTAGCQHLHRLPARVVNPTGHQGLGGSSERYAIPRIIRFNPWSDPNLLRAALRRRSTDAGILCRDDCCPGASLECGFSLLRLVVKSLLYTFHCILNPSAVHCINRLPLRAGA